MQSNIEWENKSINIFGKVVPEPRLSAWYGDVDITYTYSGLSQTAKAWTPELLEIKKTVFEHTGHHFNGALLNLYRDGRDYMGWHRDNEKELGEGPVIASVSFGEPRRFCFRKVKNKSIKKEILLSNGSLLLMQGETQIHWQHSLPKMLKVKRPRINITFRNIYT